MKNNFCGECGSKLPDGASFCGECGTAVSEIKQNKQHVKRDKPSATTTEASSQPGQDNVASDTRFNKKAILVWGLVWAGVWASLYFILSYNLYPYSYWDYYINPFHLSSWITAGGLSGLLAGVLLQWLGITKETPTFSILKKPVVIWTTCWCTLLAVKVASRFLDIYFEHSFWRLFNMFAIFAASCFGALLAWTILPLLRGDSELDFEAKRKNITVYWGGLGLLAIFTQQIFLAGFAIFF